MSEVGRMEISVIFWQIELQQKIVWEENKGIYSHMNL